MDDTPTSFSPASEESARAAETHGRPSADNRPGPRVLRVVLLTAAQLALVLLFVGGAVLGAQRLIATKPQAPQQAAPEPSYAVATVRATLSRETPTIRVFGEVEARNSVELRALVDGPVVAVHPRLLTGERVERGAVLVEIDPFEFEGAVIEATASLAEARAQRVESLSELGKRRDDLARAAEQLVIAERDLERARTLIDRGTGTEQTLDARKLTVSQRVQARDASANDVDVIHARIDQQNAVIERLEWRVRQAERDLNDAKLYAPFDAVVRAENVEPGRRLGVNDVVAELYEADALDVRFTVSDSQFGRLISEELPLIGRRTEARWSIGGAPVQASAVIDRIGADVASESGGVTLFARVEADPSGSAAARVGHPPRRRGRFEARRVRHRDVAGPKLRTGRPVA